MKFCNRELSAGCYFSCVLMLKTVIKMLLTLVGDAFSKEHSYLSKTRGCAIISGV